jgi:uncharacterized C2H2 Zn-finger protein
MSTEKTMGFTIAYVLIVIGIIVSCLLMGSGVLFFLAGSSPGNPAAWGSFGVILVIAGVVIAALAVGAFVFVRLRQRKAEPQKIEIEQKIDLSGDIELEKLKCQNCGGVLKKDSVTVREGAVFVDCPYCGVSYQMVEEPKW